MLNVFIGYDPREAAVYHVCVNSLIRRSSIPVAVTPLALNNLQGYREQHSDGSNDFIYSRFLVPHLMNYQGWALYIDGDMLLREDIAKLWEMRDEKYAVMCVHHDYKSRVSTKYMGSVNEDYPRKNWSSVILWNCAHPENQAVTPELVQAQSGAYLHRFQWLKDESVGELPKEWNWLPDELGANPEANLLHWTLGAPCFHDYADAPMSDEWHRERMLTNFCIQNAWEDKFDRGY